MFILACAQARHLHAPNACAATFHPQAGTRERAHAQTAEGEGTGEERGAPTFGTSCKVKELEGLHLQAYEVGMVLAELLQEALVAIIKVIVCPPLGRQRKHRAPARLRAPPKEGTCLANQWAQATSEIMRAARAPKEGT